MTRNFKSNSRPHSRISANCRLPVLVAVILGACAEAPEPEMPTADPELGEGIAQADCAGCHGMDGRGMEGDIPNLAAQPQDYLVEALHAYREGRRRHAALKDMTLNMSDDDIRNVAAYYAGLPPLPPTDAAPTSMEDIVYREGADVAAICEDCHGKGGFSQEPGVPSLAGQQPAYLIAATQEYVSGRRDHAEKEAMLQGLKRVDIEKMAMYFAAQTPPVRQPPPFGDPVRGQPLSAGCGECHGARGISHDPLVPSLAGQEPYYLVEAIKAYRSNAREHEDMVTDKSDEEIEDIAAFYAVQAAEAAAGESMEVRELTAKCDRCHGAPSDTMSMPVPSLDGQNLEYLIEVMQAYRDDERGSSMMHKMSSNYSDETIRAIANHYASGRQQE